MSLEVYCYTKPRSRFVTFRLRCPEWACSSRGEEQHQQLLDAASERTGAVLRKVQIHLRRGSAELQDPMGEGPPVLAVFSPPETRHAPLGNWFLATLSWTFLPSSKWQSHQLLHLSLKTALVSGSVLHYFCKVFAKLLSGILQGEHGQEGVEDLDTFCSCLLKLQLGFV